MVLLHTNGLWPIGPDVKPGDLNGSWVYTLFDGNEPVYVGASNDLRKRLWQHGRSDKTFTRWTADRYPAIELLWWEHEQIEALKPKYNSPSHIACPRPPKRLGVEWDGCPLRAAQ